MTIEELEKLGIIPVECETFTYYFIPYVGDVYFDNIENLNIKLIFEKIYKSGYQLGEINGKELKVQEIKKVLNIQ
jgi:hypothetical protein